MTTNKHAWISVALRDGAYVVRHANVNGMGLVQAGTLEDIVVSAAQRVAGTHPQMDDLEVRLPRGRRTVVSLKPAV